MNSKVYLKLYLTIVSLIFISITNGQVNDYTFSQGTFNSQWIAIGQEIIQLGYPANSLPTNNNPLKVIYAGNSAAGSMANSDSGSGYPIGFNFIYGGESFDRIAVSGNGYIKLGHSNQSIVLKNDTIAGSIFDGSSYHKNIIAAFETNASIFNTEVPVYSDGTINIGNAGLPGNRIFIAQYDYGVYINGGANLVLLDFQIQLFENDNSIRIAYKTFYNSSTLSTQGAVGIVDNQDNFSSRKVTNGVNTWPTSVAGNSISDLCDFTSALGPQGGSTQNLVYIWKSSSSIPSAPTCPEAYILVGPYYSGGIGYSYSNQYENFYTDLNNATNVPTNSIIYWSDVSLTSHQVTTYDMYLDITNPPAPATQNLAFTSYTPSTLAPNTKYYYNIVPKNASGKDSTCIGSFTTGSTPQYCNDGLPGNGFINTLTLNATSFVIPSSNSQVYVFPNTGPYTTILKRDTSYICSVIMGSSTPSGPWGRADVNIFIDFNHDGDFNDPGENIIGGSAVVNGSLTFSVPIPITAFLGNTVMRIRSKDVAQAAPIVACDPNAGSQDFIITIAPASGCETFTLNPTVTNVNCFNEGNGSIILNTTGGSIPYTVSWTDGNTNLSRTDLVKGIYKASITDANGCQISTPLIPVLQPALLTIDTTTTSNNIAVLVSGGTAPYSYLWSNGNTNNNSNGFTPSTYSITVTDMHGCSSFMQNIIVAASNCAGFIVTPTANNIRCFGQNNGSIALVVSGGATPYTFSWADGNSTSAVRNNLTQGTYQAIVTDANNCTLTTSSVTILQPTILTADTTVSANNIITVIASGGTSPYNYLWNNGNTTNNSDGFASGNYYVTVTDALGCNTTLQNLPIKKDAVIDSVNIVVFPNPTTGIIHLQSQASQTIHFTIVNEEGKLIEKGDYTIGSNNVASINLSAFTNGIYILRIMGDKSSKVVKIIRN